MEHETMEAQGKRLKELRKRLDLKQRDVAERLEMDTGTVGKWEAAMQRIPKTRLYQICNEYNVSRDWLERGEGDMFVPVEESETDFAETMYSMYNALPENFQEVWMEVAELIVKGKPTDSRLQQVCEKTFVNNGVNNGTQRID